MMDREPIPSGGPGKPGARQPRGRMLPPAVPPATPDPAHRIAALAAQLERYELALDNISVGLCFYDADRRLLLHNRRYAQMYGLAPEQIRVGMTLPEVLALRTKVGSGPRMSPDAYAALTQAHGGGDEPSGKLVELQNGRVVMVLHKPLPDGGYVSTHEDVTEQRAAERRVVHMAHHDTLTGLPNRALLHERLEQALAEAVASRPCAVLTLDLDDFKTVNDGLGYKLGDTVLRSIAERLRRALPVGNFLARLGADEFAVLQRDAEQPEAAMVLGDQLLRELERPLQIGGQTVVLDASIGIAVAPRDGLDADDVLRCAALALSSAKASGHGQIAVFEPHMDSAAQHRRTMGSDLRTAVADNALALAYQPVANLQTGRVTGFEALLRWDRPQFGRVSPAEFIPLAEENGLIVPIGAWVLRNACAEAARWPRGLRVAVNVSAAQFRVPGLYEAVVGALHASGLASSRLELEITESAMMQSWEETASLLQRLKHLGVRVSMDDFGTGYSSLSYLRKFPFDKVKIDQAFIRELTETSESVAIVRAIVALCGALGMATTAEGVETQEQFDLLVAEGCTEAQGYLLSPPRPASEIAALLARLDSAGPAPKPVRRPAFAPGSRPGSRGED